MRKRIIIKKNNYKKKENIDSNNSLTDKILNKQKKVLVFSILFLITL